MMERVCQNWRLCADKFSQKVQQLLGDDYEERLEVALRAACDDGEPMALAEVTPEMLAEHLGGKLLLARAVVKRLRERGARAIASSCVASAAG